MYGTANRYTIYILWVSVAVCDSVIDFDVGCQNAYTPVYARNNELNKIGFDEKIIIVTRSIQQNIRIEARSSLNCVPFSSAHSRHIVSIYTFQFKLISIII